MRTPDSRSADSSQPPSAPDGSFGSVAREATIRSTGLVFDKILGYAFLLLVTKTYGPAAFDAYLAGIAVVEIAFTLASLGLERAAIRAVAQYAATKRPGEIGAVIRSTLLVVAPLGAVAAACAFAFDDAIARSLGRPDAAPFLHAVAVAIPIYLVSECLLWGTEGLGYQRYATLVRTGLEPAVKVTLALAFFLLAGKEGGAGTLATAYAVSMCVGLVASVAVYRRVVVPRARGPRTDAQARPLLRVGVPLWGLELLSRLFAKAPILLLVAFAPTGAATRYSMAFSTAMLTTMIASAFEGAFRPSAARAIALERTDELRALFVRVSRSVLTICAPACLMLAFFPSLVMRVVGDQFAPIAFVLPILVVGTVASFLVGPASSVLVMGGMPRLSLRNGLAAGGLGLVLNLLLIPRFGPYGAATAQATSMIAANALNGVSARRFFGVAGVGRGHLGVVAAGVAATAAAVAVAAFAPANKYAAFFAVGATLVVVYALALVTIGIAPEDRALIATVLGKFRRRP